MIDGAMRAFEEFVRHIAGVAIGTCLALLVLALVRRQRGSTVRAARVGQEARDNHASSMLPINLYWRDKRGKAMELGPHIYATIQNGAGGSFPLVGPCFVGCDPRTIKISAICHIRVADGRVSEIVRVKWDPASQALYVQSKLSLHDMIEQVNADT